MDIMYLILSTVLLGILAWAAWRDIRSKTLPILFLIIGACSGIALRILAGNVDFLDMLLACIPGAAAFALAFFSKQAIGYGDAALITITGIFLGLSANVMLVLGSLLFSAIAAGVMLMLRKKKRKDEMPFAPFMLCSYIVLMAVNI